LSSVGTFSSNTNITFPQLYLIDILNNVRYAVPVKRASFPDKWRRQKCMKDGKNHAWTPRGQGVRDRATKQSPLPRTPYGGGAGGPSRLTPYGQGDFGGVDPRGTHYGGHAYMEPFPKGGGGVNGIGKQGGTTFVTTRSGHLWTHTWNATMGESTWLRCSTQQESGKQTYQHYRVFAMQTANCFCAGTARWDDACTTNVATYRKVAIPGPTTSQTILLTKCVWSSAEGSITYATRGGGGIPW
jgi:hypothetical protein